MRGTAREASMRSTLRAVCGPFAALLTALALTAGCSGGSGGQGVDVLGGAAVEADSSGVEAHDADTTPGPDVANTEGGGDVLGTSADGGDTASPAACKSDADCQQDAELPPCRERVCQAGQCVERDVDDGTPCKVPCGEGQCVGGICTGGFTAPCDDGNPCTVDTCGPDDECAFAPDDGAPCDDGDACTQDDACAQGACEPGAPLDCDDGDACTADACAQGACTHEAVTDCDDGDACTQDECDPQAGCAHAPLEDGACDDANPCTDDGCDPQAGCTHEPNDAPCDDGDACTEGDTCSGGVCEPGAVVCPSCTTDADCEALDDGNACNGVLGCIDGLCQTVPGSVVTCDTAGDGPCEETACDPATGECTTNPLPDGTPCADGDPCTTDTVCSSGTCSQGQPVPDCVPGCTPSDEPGCGGCACEVCVCAIDAYCCDVQWDDTCVGLCEDDCAQDCSPVQPPPPPPPPDAGCVEHATGGCGGCSCEACVCAQDAYCCNTQWDAECVAACAACGTSCPPAPPGDCCKAHPDAGCDEGPCVACVCAADATCCNASWDDACVALAQGSCAGACTCAAPPKGDCCAAHDTPGCATGPCESCVCVQDPNCCATAWDATCTSIAAGQCAAACNCASPPQGGCCTPHAGPGCPVGNCAPCVCATQPSCCTVAWDDACASLAKGQCAGPCNCLTSAGGDCCSPHAGTGCDKGSCVGCVCSKDPGCCTVAWDAACAGLAHGPCVGPCGCGNPFSCVGHCGSVAPGGCYCIASQCTWGNCCPDFESVCYGGIPSDGCSPAPTAGCGGCACEDCVCTQDPFCCAVQWDGNCVSECTACGQCGGCTPQCDGLECGDDGCGGSCGSCAVGTSCQAGHCVPTCGDGTCAGQTETCETCPDDCGACPPSGPCSHDADCFDGDPCTADDCDPASGACHHDPVADCCASDADCDDGDACTFDACTPDGCVHAAACCTDSADCPSVATGQCAPGICASGTCSYAAGADCCPSGGMVFAADFEQSAGLTAGAEPVDAAWTWTDSVAHGGVRALSASIPASAGSPPGDVWLTSPLLALPAGATATARAWVRVQGDGTLSFVWRGLDGAPVSLGQLDAADAVHWTAFEVDLGAVSGSVGRLELRYEPASAPATLWTDDWFVESACNGAVGAP